ncbi:MAG: hypothetical protein JWM82_1051 [Myxococcales bacterium]|nr:hypothetical protein [Myxococcales bacterium]
MKLAPAVTLAMLMVSSSFASLARADDKHEGHEQREQRQEGREIRGEQHQQARPEVRREEHLPARPAPPVWKGHPPGVHPASPQYHPAYHPHAVRVLRPRVAHYGEHPWHHWGHPEFVRPVYYWEWSLVHNVSCIAEDSYGDQYPVSESTFAGFGLVNMTAVEDDALDRCYDESGGDPNCYLATCSHY